MSTLATVLIIDDKSSVRKPLAALIRSAGYDVLQAADAYEGLALAKRDQPDLIVTDVVMPGMDGFDLIGRLRADPTVGHTATIFYTSMYTEDEARMIAVGCGAFRLINKSEKPHILLDAIAAALKLPRRQAVALTSEDFHQEHKRLVGDKLWQNALALENATSRLQSLISFGQRLSAERNIRRLLSGFCDEVKIILQARHVAVGIIDDGNRPNYTLSTGRVTPCRNIVAKRLPKILEEVATKQKIQRCTPNRMTLQSIRKILGIQNEIDSIQGILAIPITAGSVCFGWLCMVGKKNESDSIEFDEGDERIAFTLAAQLGLAITNRQQGRIIRRHTRDLEHRVRERTAELQRSNAALEHFAHDAAHDLQAPLDTIAGYLERLTTSPVARADIEAQSSMNAAIAAAGRMRQLIRDVLKYSQVDGAVGNATLIDSGVALTRAVDNLAINIIKAGASVTWDRLPEVYADSGQLTQVFQNLVQNAIIYRRADPLCIHIAAVRRRGNEWLISVKDNGIGIGTKDTQRIFNLFQRLHGHDRYPGNGIGLAMCKKIIERNGGRIWVESKPGEGSTFYFTLLKSTRGVRRAAA